MLCFIKVQEILSVCFLQEISCAVMSDRALHMLFPDVEYADKHLKNSLLWSAQNVFPGGRNNYNKWRRELGLLED